MKDVKKGRGWKTKKRAPMEGKNSAGEDRDMEKEKKSEEKGDDSSEGSEERKRIGKKDGGKGWEE